VWLEELTEARMPRPDQVRAAGKQDSETHEMEKGAAPETVMRSPTLGHSESCAEAVHGINNALLTIVLNSQLIDWKLPSYSKIRRNVHEIERSAQVAGVLIKRLIAKTVSRKPTEKELPQAFAETSGLELTHVQESPCPSRVQERAQDDAAGTID
jgi:hypothetical protein